MRAVTLMLLLASLTACLSRDDERLRGAEAEVVVRSDVELLAATLRLAYPPESGRWIERPLGTPGGLGPTDYLYVAELRFDDATLAEIRRRLDAATPLDSPLLSSELVHDWFSEELGSAFVPADHGAVSISEPVYDVNLLLEQPTFGGHTFLAPNGALFISASTR